MAPVFVETMAEQVKLITFWLCFLYYGLVLSVQEEPEVTLSGGRVRGQKPVSAVNRSYYSFRGIPYAAPPVGNLRFKAPQPPKSWNGTLLAFDIPPACSQPWRQVEFPETYSEDCLYINVFTRHLKPPRGVPMPVMVYIHGGKLYRGSCTTYKYGPDFLITEDIVLVTFNYRLGVFGYLNSNSKSAQGNAAEKDKVAALKWVQKEIRHFGGDPNKVTIFGDSSGAHDVTCIYLSKMAKGLFHRAIAQSPTECLTAGKVIDFNPNLKLAKILGCPVSDPEDMVTCLRCIPAIDLAEKQMEVTPQGPGQPANAFLLTLEESHGEEVFMSVPAEKLLKTSESSVPYMTGINSGEGIMYVDVPEKNPTQFSDFERDFELYLPLDIRKNRNRRSIDDIIKILRKYYFNNEHVSNETIPSFMNFMMDKTFTYPVIKTAKALSLHAPVYLYYFAFEGEFIVRRENSVLNLRGVNHGNELGYLFLRSKIIPEQLHLSQYPREMVTVTRMVRLWTNFAKYGNPTPNSSDEVLAVTWLPLNESLTQHLVINDSLIMETQDLFPERMAIWDTVTRLNLPDDKVQTSLALGILAFILALSVVSLLYLLYESSCRRVAYIEL